MLISNIFIFELILQRSCFSLSSIGMDSGRMWADALPMHTVFYLERALLTHLPWEVPPSVEMDLCRSSHTLGPHDPDRSHACRHPATMGINILTPWFSVQSTLLSFSGCLSHLFLWAKPYILASWLLWMSNVNHVKLQGCLAKHLKCCISVILSL